MRKLCMTVLAAALLAGCTTVNPTPAYDPLARFQTINMKVSAVESKNAYNPITTTSDVAYKFGTTPAQLVQQYISKRYHAEGSGDGILRFTINRASAIETDVPPENKFVSAFQLNEQKKLTVTLNVTADLVGSAQYSKASAQFTAERARTFPVTASIGERESSKDQMVAEMLDDLDKQMMRAFGNQNFHLINGTALDTSDAVQPIVP